MFQPAYYLGRRVHVMHCTSHPCTYVYQFARFQGKRVPVLRLVKTESFWR